MAVTFVAAGAGAAVAAAPNDISVAYPAGLAADDLMVVHLFSRNTISTLDTIPSGWTLLFGPDASSSHRQWLYYKFATGSESGSMTWSISGSALFMGRCFAFRGVALSSFTEGGSAGSGTDASIEIPSVTTTDPNELAVAFISVANDLALGDATGESGGNYTEAATDFNSSLGLDGAMQLQTATMASAGTVSGGSYTMAASEAWVCRAFALRAVGAETAPDPPTLDDAIPSDTSIVLAWTAPAFDGGSAITGYKVYRGTSSGSETLLTTLGDVTTYDDSSVSNGTTYFYTVTAVNAEGESDESNELQATPYAETFPLIVLCTEDAANGCSIFFIGSGLTPGNFYSLHKFNTNPAVTNDGALGSSSEADSLGRVLWQITSADSDGQAVIHDPATAAKSNRASNVVNYGWSGTVEVCPGTPGDGDNLFLSAPILIRTAGDDQVSLDWSASTPCDATFLDQVIYDVQRSTTGPTSGFSSIASDLSATDYLDTGVSNGTTYWYRIDAEADWMTSELYGVARFASSNVVSATPQDVSVTVALSVRVPLRAP